MPLHNRRQRTRARSSCSHTSWQNRHGLAQARTNPRIVSAASVSGTCCTGTRAATGQRRHPGLHRTQRRSAGDTISTQPVAVAACDRKGLDWCACARCPDAGVARSLPCDRGRDCPRPGGWPEGTRSRTVAESTQPADLVQCARRLVAQAGRARCGHRVGAHRACCRGITKWPGACAGERAAADVTGRGPASCRPAC